VYWREALGGELPVLELQTDHPRPAVLTTNGSSVPLEVDASTAAALWGLCKARGITMMRGALAAWAVALSKHSGQSEVVVGVPYANREHSATHDIVGYFVNTLAIRLPVEGRRSFKDTLVEANRVVNACLAHAEVPFMKVVEAVAPERDASRTPIFQTMLTWNEAPGTLTHVITLKPNPNPNAYP